MGSQHVNWQIPRLTAVLFRSPLNRFRSTPSTPQGPSPLDRHDYAKHTERCPLGMRVALYSCVIRRTNVKQEIVMESTLPASFERGHQEQRSNPRRSVRGGVALRMIVADKAGLASGQVVDMTTRGCGLCLSKPLTRGQYLTLKVYPADGTASVQCDVAKVQWVEENRAGLVFLWMLLENDRRLRRLCADRLVFQCED